MKKIGSQYQTCFIAYILKLILCSVSLVVLAINVTLPMPGTINMSRKIKTQKFLINVIVPVLTDAGMG